MLNNFISVKRNYYYRLFFTFSLFISANTFAQKSYQVLSVPGIKQYTHINTTGKSVLASGRYVTPVGETIQITHDPFGMAISPDGKKTVTIHNGVFTIIDNETLANTRVPSYDSSIKSPFSNGSFLGVAFAPDSKKIYLSGGDNGAVIVYDIEKFQRLDSISLNGEVDSVNYEDSFTSDLLLNESSNELLVLDRGNFRMVRIDLTTKKITASIKTGRQPFGLAISPDKKIAFVANVGMYDYPLLPDLTPKNYDSLLIPVQPYGNDTKESIEGYTWHGRKIPGVGSPSSPEAMSVYTIDLNTNKVIDRFKTGYQVGQMVEGAEVTGGASPNSIAVGNKYAYVTNATNDNISVIDYREHKIISHIDIKTDPLIDHYRGLLPFGISLSKDEKTLYVALLGFNAVAVIDVDTKITKGLIPTGWGTTRVLPSRDEKYLYVISCRGYGAGPNGGKDFIAPVQGTYIGDIQLATFQKIKIPDEQELAAYTKEVINNTFTKINVTDDGKNPLPPLQNMRESPIKYIVYITKENRTYDEVLGQLKTGIGDSTLARFGVNVNIIAKDKTLHHVNIAPNHLKIAKQFSYGDNYYCDSDASIHGHHWMMGVIPNEWVETNSSVDKTSMLFSKASGRRFPGSTGSMDPEDYAERGGLWEAMERSKISFYNFGEANETAHNREEWFDTATGSGHGVMVPMQKALYPRTSHNYAGFNTNIPDQFRMEQFETEFTKMWLKGKGKMPQLITMQVPNDHTASARPEFGYPYYHSYVADNDLAVGRILHFLSRTLYWKNMLVIITEDDPQGGVDHIDAHRSILMMAGPYVKRGYVSHTHANFGSILKTIYTILNVPYVNQYDVTATLLQDFFTDKPNYKPYTLEFPSKQVFDPQIAMKRYNRKIDWHQVMKGPEMDDEGDLRKEHYQQQGVILKKKD
ncbi:MAG TPA: bifunctional YncE family protein/alkaline phosphatase family protein [Chitinophagaceae bacterium]|nr:bifunctional YncE family protein/alkaline phosphatase family protein [Chitinophagaceae bacterium]